VRSAGAQLDLGFVDSRGPVGVDGRLRRWRVGSRTLESTAVFDTYWRFAAERQEVLLRRVAGDRPPWTADPVLLRHKFTNAYRASDRVSQYLISRVIYAGSQDPVELTFRVVLFKLFNRIETWDLLERELGCVSWEGYEFGQFDAVLSAALARGERVYSAAYIVPPPQFGMVRKHQNHLCLIEHMMAAGLPDRIHDAPDLKSLYEVVRSFPSLGPFLAYQLAIDLNYSTLVDHSEMEFVVPGPGARDGLAKCFRDTGGLDDADIIRWVTETAPEHFARLGLEFRDLWGRPLQLIDCQNLFCETDKYARVAHPEVAGRRSRIKQIFTPTPTRIEHRYPPKWRLPAEVTASLTQSPAGR
jgi:hypothetical protein